MEKISDHSKIVLPLVLSQYQRASRLLGLIRSGCAQADDVEDAMHQIREGFKLSKAVGVQLDKIGALYRERRLGRSDTDYRQAIQIRASMAVNGTPEEILSFLRFALGATDCQYFPEHPAGYVILTDSETLGVGTGVLDAISPAGVRGLFASPMLTFETDGEPMLTHEVNGEPMYGVRAS